MGSVFRGIPKEAALSLKKELNLQVMIETGTLVGASASWGAQHFDYVYTIELNEDIYNRALRNIGGHPKITMLHGHSVDFLPHILEKEKRPSLVWLDAHWSRDLQYNAPVDICPLIKEIEVLREAPQVRVIMIDDVRLFGSNGWPTMDQIITLFHGNQNHWVMKQASDVLFLKR